MYSVQWVQYGSVQRKHSVSVTVSSIPHPGMWTSDNFIAPTTLCVISLWSTSSCSHGLLDIKGEIHCYSGGFHDVKNNFLSLLVTHITCCSLFTQNMQWSGLLNNWIYICCKLLHFSKLNFTVFWLLLATGVFTTTSVRHGLCCQFDLF